MGKIHFIALFVLILVAIGISVYMLLNSQSDGGWEKVPRKAYEYEQLPGEEITIRGLLEPNDRVILSIHKGGEIELITEEQVNSIVQEGLKDDYDFRKPGWTHRLLADLEFSPSFEDGGDRYYLLINSGTDIWRSEDVYSRFEGREVEILGKWDVFTDSDYPALGTIQFMGRSIRPAS